MVSGWRVARQRNSMLCNIGRPLGIFQIYHIIVSFMQFNWQVFRKALEQTTRRCLALFCLFHLLVSYSPNWHKLLTRCKSFISSATRPLAQVANMRQAIPINLTKQKLIIKYLNTWVNEAQMHPIALPLTACLHTSHLALLAAPVQSDWQLSWVSVSCSENLLHVALTWDFFFLSSFSRWSITNYEPIKTSCWID